MPNNPINPLVAEMVNKLNPIQREDFEERAGIMEFDGELSRAHAECLALLDVLNRNPNVLSGVIVLKTAAHWVITTDTNSASHIHVIRHNLASVLETEFNGNAALKPI